MRLSELKTGQSATILKVLGHGGFRRRIMEMGFVRGKRVDVLQNAPLHDPIKYRIMDYEVSLRRSEAAMIVVMTAEEARQKLEEPHVATAPDETSVEEVITSQHRTINVALIGNPNSGKTSLFNAISGGHEHVGNYSGVTVDAKRGEHRYRGYRFIITDLPGTYALSAYTPEELYVRRHLVNDTPDVVINAVVASNLERNLYLTTELIDIDPKMVVALNMYDELEASGAALDYEHLGAMLGVPMVPVVARTRRGLQTLLDTVIAVYENEDQRVRHIHINNGPVIEQALQPLYERIREHRDELPKHFPPRYFAMKMLERDKEVEAQLSECPHYAEWCTLRDRAVPQVEEELGEDVETAFANQKYGFISGALKETYVPGEKEQAQTTRLIDAFVTHRLWGFPVFFFLMWLMFYCTFNIGQYPQAWIESLVGWIGSLVERTVPDGSLKALLVDGVIGGVGSVIVFLPNIVILYLFISFMEDSGYLARAAFIMDRVMHRIGLHGKSFIPLVMGFGCNVPAIMATRTIESRSSRLITVLITPFMSCSARLPIYILFAGTFFPTHAGWVLFSLYLLGILMAMATARLMRRFFYKVDETPFVMELPPYRLPTWRSTLSHMWDKSAQYLRKMGGLILVASLIVWFLSYFPRPAEGVSEAAHYENSYLGRIGHWCEPLVEPLGLNWKSGVAILSGISAKEIVVSTLGVLYSNDAGTTETSLSQTLRESGDFTPASALAFLVFSLIYFPCIATVAAVRSEAGRGWACATMLYNTVVAWLMAWGVYHLALIL
ncbi:ferrous iron transport protein B [uncultured Alistipes sp.]|uniref:ferrous iron transport protein B n=1 Tax=uncultured Alistipes sp. TaxID=538949 RepID=UPI002609249E|nr:ferrous iron transport protein B [uncultured Alistipes sp.]